MHQPIQTAEQHAEMRRIPIADCAERHARDKRSGAQQYADTQREADRVVAELDALLGRTSEPHLAAVRELIAASERAARLSRGYTPEHPTEMQKVGAIHRLILALWFAFGLGAGATYLYFALAVHS
jgi:uncharacterized membrane protein YqiK